MIFKKGEIVEVVSSSVESGRYIGKVGRVCAVEDLEEDEYPFVVKFYEDGKRSSQPFNHKELRILDRFNDLERKQSHIDAAKMFELRKKI